MRCYVNHREVPSTQLARRETNFGQSYPSHVGPSPYVLHLTQPEFVQRASAMYQQAVREEVADEPYHRRGDWHLLDRLQDLHYPPLEVLCQREPELLAELIQEWLHLDILDLVIPGPEEGLPEYLVNTIDRVTVAADGVRLEGQAYPHPALATAP